ncbi:MBL fold metallo-hydrolase [Tissierella sp. MB52-C2]|uniref:MBL fold metallo-hydrolase n=1 Tax=Tissierella sp. MB52-C2 TaxID=3070999 RepID=UPI00280B7928|nr:MBL fold metallo-hydrolase [Tissierella sp. MB52-C2]WMM25186.1 MBL fold metallo-hydrolase [Tissierella sp. MB52-C2]
MKNFKKIITFIFAIIVIISLTACEDIMDTNSEVSMGEVLEVHFIDVGQADSIFIKKGEEAMLIDAGDNKDGKTVVDYIKKQNVSKLNYVIGTHPHADHIGGLDDVIDNFPIDKIIMPNAIANTKTFEDVLDSIDKKGLKITKPKVGDRYDLDGAEFIVLAPNGEDYASLNDYSVVVKLINGETSFLFTGDAEALSENEILKNNRNLLKSDVLKVGHHGSVTSTSQDFLEAVNPYVAVISSETGNSYGHPHKEIIERLTEKNIDICRTDLQGTIIIKSNGKGLEFNDKEIVLNNSSPVNKPDVIISHVDKIEEIVTIKNNSKDEINLEGWKLLSVTGNQEYIFPKYVLKGAEVVTVTSGDKEGDLNWGSNNIWNNTKSDPAVLYDESGKEIFRFND